MAVPGDVVISEITSGALCVFVIQELKRWFPWIEGMQGWITRGLSALWALVSVILISYEWSPSANGGGSLTLVLPSLGAALMAIWHWANQFAVNEVIYRTTVRPAAASPAPKK